MPEQPSHNIYYRSALAHIERQLELAEGIENPINRFFKREKLLERQDELQDEFDASDPSEE